MDFEQILSPRIIKHCLPLYKDGHSGAAAREAMIQVELAIKEKAKVEENIHGHVLIERVFGIGNKSRCIKPRVPLGEDLQFQAKEFFKGAFSYYRNYAAHDGANIGEHQCFRIMILASELLDLIDASFLTFTDIGGVEGLVKLGAFTSREQVQGLLKLLDGYTIVDEGVDGLYEEMLETFGADALLLRAVMELDLVRCEEMDYAPTPEELRTVWARFSPPQTIGCFSLTDLGKEFLQKIDEGGT